MMIRRGFQRYWPAISWGMGILILTGFPGSMFPKVPGFLDLFEADKIIHLILFGGFMIMLFLGFRKEPGWKIPKALLLAGIISLAFGALTEVLQVSVFINRQGSVWDFIANAAGVGLGIILCLLRKVFFHSRNNKNNSYLSMFIPIILNYLIHN